MRLTEHALKILFAVARFDGRCEEGSATLAALQAERLSRRFTVEIATTTAGADGWAPRHAAGSRTEGRLLVHRFDARELPSSRAVPAAQPSLSAVLDRRRRRMPPVPALVRHVAARRDDYAAIFFFGQRDAAGLGLVAAGPRAILVPLAQEQPLDDRSAVAVLRLPRAFGFATEAERDRLADLLGERGLEGEVIAPAVDAPPSTMEPDGFRARHGVEGPLLVYLGTASEEHDCDLLVAHWSASRDRPQAQLKTLAFVGGASMALPDRPDLLALGDRDGEGLAATSAADLVVAPAWSDGVGLPILRAWRSSKPVLVAAQNEVLSALVRTAGGGAMYSNTEEFIRGVNALVEAGPELGASGHRFVQAERAPEQVDERLARLVARVSS